MTALIVVLPLIVVVEISLQLHRSSSITAGRVGLSCSTVSNFVEIASSIIVFFC
jgi:hypothetical protein